MKRCHALHSSTWGASAPLLLTNEKEIENEDT